MNRYFGYYLLCICPAFVACRSSQTSNPADVISTNADREIDGLTLADVRSLLDFFNGPEYSLANSATGSTSKAGLVSCKKQGSSTPAVISCQNIYGPEGALDSAVAKKLEAYVDGEQPVTLFCNISSQENAAAQKCTIRSGINPDYVIKGKLADQLHKALSAQSSSLTKKDGFEISTGDVFCKKKNDVYSCEVDSSDSSESITGDDAQQVWQALPGKGEAASAVQPGIEDQYPQYQGVSLKSQKLSCFMPSAAKAKTIESVCLLLPSAST